MLECDLFFVFLFNLTCFSFDFGWLLLSVSHVVGCGCNECIGCFLRKFECSESGVYFLRDFECSEGGGYFLHLGEFFFHM